MNSMDDIAMSHEQASDSEDELPLDLNPNLTCRPAIADFLLRHRKFRSKEPNYRDAVLASVSLVEQRSLSKTTSSKTFLRSYIASRPKPPIPSNYFVHLDRNWRRLSKEEIRDHIVCRFAARDQYIAACQAWERLHDQWANRVYRLMRIVIKAQRRVVAQQVSDRMDLDMEPNTETDDTDEIETVLDELAEEDASQAATELEFTSFATLDKGGTAVTDLQEEAEADQQERARRWFMSHFKRIEQARKSSRFVAPPLLRAGPKGTFGLALEGDARARLGRTPSIDLPRAARLNILACNLHTCSTSRCSASGVQVEKDSTTSANGASEELHPWCAYSTECSCGYAGCFCRQWLSWWDSTHDMLEYVECADIPIPIDSNHPSLDSPRHAIRIYPSNPASIEFYQNPSEAGAICEAQIGMNGWIYDRFASPRLRMQPRCSHPEGLNPRYLEQITKSDLEPLSHDISPAHRYAHEEAPNGTLDEDPRHPSSQRTCTPATNISTILECHNRGDSSWPFACKPTETTSTKTDSHQHNPKRFIKLRWEEYVEKDPAVANEYTPEVFRVLIDELEPTCLPNLGSPKKDINWRSRTRFVHWMAYAHYCCNLAPQILFLSVNLMDRFIARYDSSLNVQWDLLAATCLWTAWKFEGVPSSLRSVSGDIILRHANVNNVSLNDMISMEWNIHRTLEHDLSYPGPLVFMRQAFMAFDARTKEMAYLARFFIEISLTSRAVVSFRPSSTAAAAVWLARELEGVAGWTSQLELATTWKAHDLYAPLCHIILVVLEMPRELKLRGECAIFYKWVHPSVSDLAIWSRDVFRRVWPTPCGINAQTSLLRIRELVQSPGFSKLKRIDPGPPNDSSLFEV